MFCFEVLVNLKNGLTQECTSTSSRIENLNGRNINEFVYFFIKTSLLFLTLPLNFDLLGFLRSQTITQDPQDPQKVCFQGHG